MPYNPSPLLWSCLFYVIAYAGFSAITPLLSIFLRSLGLHASGVGLIAGCRPFALFLGLNWWGSVADRWQKKRVVHCMNLCVYVALCLFLAQLSGSPQPHVAVDCADNKSLPSLSNSVTKQLASEVKCTDSEVSGEADRRIARFVGDRIRHGVLLPLVLTATVVADFFASSWASLADLATLDHLGDSRSRFGYQRLWGSFGLGFGTLALGVLAQTTRSENAGGGVVNGNYQLCFYVAAALWLFSALVASRFQFRDHKAADSQERLRTALRQVLRPAVAVYLCAVLVLGCNMGLMMNFIFWFMQDLAAGQLVVGLAGLLAQLSDIVTQLVSEPVIAWLGHVRTMYIAMFTYGVRNFILSVIHNKWLAFIPQAMFGLTFGLPWASMANFVRNESEPGTEAFMQGALHSMHWGVGCGVGAILGGILIEQYGIRATFRLASYADFGLCVLFFVAQQVLHWHEERENKQEGYQLVDRSTLENSAGEEESVSQWSGEALPSKSASKHVKGSRERTFKGFTQSLVTATHSEHNFLYD